VHSAIAKLEVAIETVEQQRGALATRIREGSVASIAIFDLVLGDQLAQASAIGTITTWLTLLLVLAASRLAGENMADLFR
jgi:hypothetical protein